MRKWSERFISILLTICISVASSLFALDYYLTHSDRLSKVPAQSAQGSQNAPQTPSSTQSVPGASQDEPGDTALGQLPSNVQSASFADIIDRSMRATVGIAANGERIIGSGFLVNDQGYVATNAHVVTDQNMTYQTVNVKMPDNQFRKGQVILVDHSLDLAIVDTKSPSKNFLPLGDSSKIRVGEEVIAIGNPLGENYQKSVTRGIISGTDRSVQVSQYSFMDHLLQTDASINGGNSGGPLIDQRGYVVGVNNAKLSSNSGASIEGMGFSIPSNTLKKVLEAAQKGLEYEKVKLGIAGFDLRVFPENTTNERGVLLGEVMPGSPAEKAGLQKGDILLSLNGQSVAGMTDVSYLLYDCQKGQQVSVEVERAKKKISLSLTF